MGAALAGRGDLAPAALTEAHAWVEAQLTHLGARGTGPIEQVHERPWSTVLRVPTDRGDLYLKSCAPALRHEAAITAFLARRRPDVVPAPLAVDLEQGWMLMADAGTQLRELVEAEHDVSRWLEVLPLYAQLQVDLGGNAAELLALGAPDLRLAGLPGRYAELLDELEDGEQDGRPGASAAGRSAEVRRLREAVPRVAAMCADLAGFAIPETIQHDDLNDAAIYARDGRYVILDWGDACVSHPFFSMSVALEGVIAWGADDIEGSVDTAPFRDAYLAPFADGRDADAIRAACELAIRLGWAARAVNGHAQGFGAEPTWTRLRMFLDGHP